MRSCSALGVGGGGVGAHAANSEGSKAVTAQIMTFFVVRDMGQLTVPSPIARKRSVNRHDAHQPSINCPFNTAVTYRVSTLRACTAKRTIRFYRLKCGFNLR